MAALVGLAASAPGTSAFQNYVTELSTIMSKQVPAAPLIYGPDWDVYSTLRFDNWVTPKNQYAYPGPGGNNVAYVLTQLVKSKG